MKKIILALTVFFVSSTVFAQKIKVRRVKGKQAVVEFSGGTLQTGQVYEIAPDEYGDMPGSSSSSRNYLVAVNFLLENTKADSPGSENSTKISLATRFGWNLGHIEVGPLFTFTTEASAVTSTTYRFGGFADYNLIANAPGESFLYGLGGTMGIGSHDSGTGSKNDMMDFFVGPFAKWFPSGKDYGFRVDAGYVYQKLSTSIGDITTSGISSSVGLIAYF